MRRLLALTLAVLGLLLLGALPAQAATKNAGIPDITPYGGYLGNYVAPDGFRVYCIDSPLPWPAGATSDPVEVETLVTTWGATLPSGDLQKLNYVLLTYGQTDDPVQAAAVAAFVNAYTSGWAHDMGAGYEAGAWYINGNAAVTAVYDTIWADAEANAAPTGTATVHLDVDAGTVAVTASPAGATGTVTLQGAVRTDTGQSTFPVAASDVIAITGVPDEDDSEYQITAHADFSAVTPAGTSLMLYTTPDEQRTIRGGAQGSLAFSAEDVAIATAPPRLAATGGETKSAGLVAASLLGCGVLLIAGARRRGNNSRHEAFPLS